MAEQKSARLSLKRLGIQRFRSLYDVSLDLKPINIFIGPNGSGKSNLIAFFRFSMIWLQIQSPAGDTARRPEI
jgi:ABC-type cobalamin/Fe3+-siderophores transport system ATPase subunit